MSTVYPAALDDWTNPTSSDNLNDVDVPHASQHANHNDAIEMIEATLGTVPLTKFVFDVQGDLIVGADSNEFTRLPAGTNGQILAADSDVTGVGLKWINAAYEPSGNLTNHANSTSDPHSLAGYAILIGGGRKIFAQTTDPGSASVNGDIWLQVPTA